MAWHNIIKLDNLPPGQHHVCVIEHKAIAVFNLDGQLYAIEDYCPHQGLPLSDGCIKDHQIECPFHGARFCLKTGEVTAPPAYTKLNTYPVKVEQGTVKVDLSL